MSIRISASFAIALLLAFASALQASDTTFVSQGARVKLFPTQPGAKVITGNVTDLVSDTLVVVPEGGGEALTFDGRDLRKIEVSQGKKGNALLGLGVGTAVGAAFGLIACEASDYGCWTNGTNLTAGVTAVFAVGLGGLGAGVGALIKTERWKEAEMLAPPPVALNVGNDGSVRLAFSLRL
jgi:hypothetical protein